MRYLIDGYNLIFRVEQSALENLPLYRQEVIKSLSNKIESLQLNATIVFDAHLTPEPSSRGHHRDLELFYTSYRETADEWILRTLSEHQQPSQCTVVTSDKDLARKARLIGAHAVSVNIFLQWLEKRFQNKISGKKTKKPKPTSPPIEISKLAISQDPDYLQIFSQNLQPPDELPENLSPLKKCVEPEIPVGEKIEENLLEYYERIFKERMDTEGTR